MESRAWYHRTNYWAHSGAERARMRRRWDAEARAEEEAERRRFEEKRARMEERDAESAARMAKRAAKAKEKEDAWNAKEAQWEAEREEKRRLKEQKKELRALGGKKKVTGTADGGTVVTFECKACHNTVHAKMERVESERGVMGKCPCPECGYVNYRRLVERR